MLSINLGWGFGVLIGVLVAGPVSGAHLNPAVSTALAAVGKFDWKKLGPFILAQYLGAFLGAALVFFTYKDAIDMFTGPGDYQELFRLKEQTQPPGYLSLFQDQAFQTSMEPWIRWLEPPCFFLPSARSTTRQTPQFLQALALFWSDWSSSTLASALDIMQVTRSTQPATLDQDCSSLLLVGAPRPSQVITIGGGSLWSAVTLVDFLAPCFTDFSSRQRM